jgi:lipopolysaccharide transport system permease protein
LGGVIDFALAFAVLLGMMAFYGIVPPMSVFWLPLLFLLTLITCLGTSFWLSALNVQFRDIRYTLPFITQLWLFATPISYPSSLIKNPILKAVYALNPMVGVVEGFRWALLGVDAEPGAVIVVSTLVALALFFSGAYYFRRMEKVFADII